MKRSFSIWRVLVVTGAVILVLGGVAWYKYKDKDFLPSTVTYRPANSIMVIAPYRYAGTWVFDDAAVGLAREPFVVGIPEMIDEIVKDIPGADKGFRLLFSAQAFPEYTHKLIWKRGDKSGNWYYSEKYNKEGWLCPGLFKYYQKAPKEIYVKAEAK
jgi:hypothetical protein